MLAVFTVAAMPDVIPAMPSDRVGKLPIPHGLPRATIVRRAEPSAVAIDEIEPIVPDDIVIPSIRDCKAIVIEVNEIGAGAYTDERPVAAKIEL
jgi:hypothetical protein